MDENRVIYEAILNGETRKALATRYGLTCNAIDTIFRREKRKEASKDYRFYQILVDIIDKEETKTRMLNVIQRNGFGTDEELLKVNKNMLLKCRNCGEGTANLILKVADILREENSSLDNK